MRRRKTGWVWTAWMMAAILFLGAGTDSTGLSLIHIFLKREGITALNGRNWKKWFQILCLQMLNVPRSPSGFGALPAYGGNR